jgi:hypothetical protein
MKTETFDSKEAFLQALHGATRKRARATRSAGTGLSTLLLQGWCNEYNAKMEMRLYRGDVSTPFFADERAAVLAAKELERGR